MNSSNTTKRDQSESVDGSRGWLSAQEISNVWMERMRRLDAEIWPERGRTPSRDEILEFFTTIRVELFNRASGNFAAVTVPPVRAKKAEPPTEQALAEAYKERKERLSKFR